MAKRVLLLIAVFLTVFSLATGFVSAAIEDEGEESGGEETEEQGELDNGLWKYQGDASLIQQYVEATERCDTPSLECLVFYTVNYTAIQLTNSIAPIQNVSDSGQGSVNASGYSGPTFAGQQGIVPGLSYLIGQMYSNPAANTHTYVADVMNSAGVAVAPPAYAQGLGFVALNPILDLWKTFRNIAYMFYVLIFVVIGFLIMFRQKVNQQAITAQQAIPSIIVSLLFVTFSYAIAGFLIDLMYLSMYLILGIFQGISSVPDNIINYNIFQLTWEFMKTGSSAGMDVTSNIVSLMIQEALNLGGGGVADAIGWVAGITVGLVIAIAVLVAAFKLFFELLKSYATIVLMVVTAPVQLMVGAIPGRNAVGPWIRNLVGNLAAFPVVLMSAIMFQIFVSGTAGADTGGFLPPFLVGRGVPSAITGMMGLAILLAIPEIVKKIKEKLGASSGIGEMVASAGWENAKAGWSGQGSPLGIGVKPMVKKGVSAAGHGALGAAIAYDRFGRTDAEGKPHSMRRKIGVGLGGFAAGGAVGAIGRDRTIGRGLRALNQYGELAENLPGMADWMEQTAVGTSRGKLHRPVSWIRENRKGPAESKRAIYYDPTIGKVSESRSPSTGGDETEIPATTEGDRRPVAPPPAERGSESEPL